MKPAFLFVFGLLPFSPVLADAADTLTLPAKNGDVRFNHRMHAALADASPRKCMTCHPAMAGGKIPGFGKEMAHKNCRGCHEERKAGPTRCGQCHRRQ